MYLNQMKENGDYGYKLGPNGTKYSGYETLNMAVDLIWEEARKQDLGIDLKLFNDDLSIIFDIFKERRENILLKRENSIPSFLGYNTSAPYGNIGIVENKGFDATVEYNKRFNKDWTLAIRGNITYNKDKWIEGELPEQRYDWMNQYGQNILGKKGYIAEGLFTQAEIDDMARTYTEGYRIGFITGRKDITRKKTVNIRYHLGNFACQYCDFSSRQVVPRTGYVDRNCNVSKQNPSSSRRTPHGVRG